MNTIRKNDSLATLKRKSFGVKELTNQQLRNCHDDAYSMIVEPGNGVTEYRLALVQEMARRRIR